MAFLDKLKNGGIGLLNWIWQNTVGRIEHLINQKLSDYINVKVVSGVLERIKDFILAPFRWLKDALNSVFNSIHSAVQVLPAPLQIIVMISLAGVIILGVVWVLKRLYELL